MVLKPFSTNVPLLYPLKASENLRFSDVFRAYRRRTLVENGLKRFHSKLTNLAFWGYMLTKRSSNIWYTIKPKASQNAISKKFSLFLL